MTSLSVAKAVAPSEQDLELTRKAILDHYDNEEDLELTQQIVSEHEHFPGTEELKSEASMLICRKMLEDINARQGAKMSLAKMLLLQE